jgi:hypothetical protein
MRDDDVRLENDLRGLRSDLDARIGRRDLSAAVIERLTPLGPTPVVPYVPRTRARRSRLRVAVLVLIVAALAVVAIPPARAAVARLLRIGGEEIHRDKPPPSRATVPTPTPGVPLPDLGDRVTLEAARRRIPVVVPTEPGLGSPDEVWLNETGGGRVSLVYNARAGLPAAPHTGAVGLLLQEFGGDGTVAVTKYLSIGTDVEPVAIDPYHGVFLSGAHHAVWYNTPDGQQITEIGRLAGNALIFQRGPLTIRLEGDAPRDQLAAIAASLK